MNGRPRLELRASVSVGEIRQQRQGFAKAEVNVPFACLEQPCLSSPPWADSAAMIPGKVAARRCPAAGSKRRSESAGWRRGGCASCMARPPGTWSVPAPGPVPGHLLASTSTAPLLRGLAEVLVDAQWGLLVIHRRYSGAIHQALDRCLVPRRSGGAGALSRPG